MQKKIFIDALRREKVPRVPFWFMRQAGRYLPEYRELRAKKAGFLDMAFDPDAMCEITLQPIRRFGMDAAVIFSDILTVPYALGQDLKFVEGEGPKLGELNISKLNFNQFESRQAAVYSGIGKIKNQLVSEGFGGTAVLGFAGAPWTVVAYMIEGGGSADFLKARKMAYAEPENFSVLIDLLIEATAHHLIRQIENGAEAVQIFDSHAGVLDADQFRNWVILPTSKIVAAVRDVYPQIPIIGFPRGGGQNLLAYVQETGVSAVSLDSQIPPKWAARALQSLIPVQGNLDPACLLVGGDALRLAVEKILGELSGGPFVFNLGHGIHKDTPVEHVEALVAMIKEKNL
jgi:uroporphyrinogen decarboxylase